MSTAMAATRHTLITGDARRLEAIPTGSVHLVLTSPPYPMIQMWDELFRSLSPEIGEEMDARRARQAWELMHRVLDRAWDQVARVLAPGGIACVNIGDAVRTVGSLFRLYTNHARVTAALETRGLDSLPAILWRKPINAPNKFMGSGMLPGAYVTLEHEHILIHRKGEARGHTPASRARRLRSAYFWEERNTWFSDVWDLRGTRQTLPASHGSQRSRSAAFPFELAYRLVAMYSMQGDTVLDPFVGTGTTVLAAAALGRGSVGVDNDAELARAAGKMLSESMETLNQWTRDRLDRHVSFVSEALATGRLLRHHNGPHDTAVMTAQERHLVLDLIQEIRREGDGVYAVSYRGMVP